MNYDIKIQEYENKAVTVANSLHDNMIRSESSKRVIESFPNVRLTSEKKQGKKGNKFLSSLLITSLVGLGCYSVGYERGAIPVKKELFEVKKKYQQTIEDLIEKDLAKREDFIFIGNIDEFIENYGNKILSKKPDLYQKFIIKQHFWNCLTPIQIIDLENTINSAKTALIYHKKKVNEVLK